MSDKLQFTVRLRSAGEHQRRTFWLVAPGKQPRKSGTSEKGN